MLCQSRQENQFYEIILMDFLRWINDVYIIDFNSMEWT